MAEREPKDGDYTDLKFSEVDSVHADFCKLYYEKATQMHVETVSGMYQIISIFVGASLILLGWTLGEKSDQLSRELIGIIGSLAVVLVGVATILKHRLRYYNKLREIYLRKIESKILENTNILGLHHFMAGVSAKKTELRPQKSLAFHQAIDIYFFIYMFVWILVYFVKINSYGPLHNIVPV